VIGAGGGGDSGGDSGGGGSERGETVGDGGTRGGSGGHGVLSELKWAGGVDVGDGRVPVP